MLRRAPARRRGTDRGSVLLLLPAAVLVVLVLASIAVDFALVHLRQRQALDLAASAANDAATAGADPAVLRQGGYALDPARVRRVVRDAIASSDLAARLAEPPTVVVQGDTVEVGLAIEADYLFTGVVPGAPDDTVVRVRAAATAIPSGTS